MSYLTSRAVDLSATLRRIFQVATLRRDPIVWMQLEPAATGDALIIVVATGIAFFIAAVGGEAFDLVILRVLIDSLIGWLILSATVWASGRFIFDARGLYAEILRLVGFAFPAWLLRIVTDQFFDRELSAIVGSVWFLAAIAAGVKVMMDLPTDKAWAATVIGFAGWLLIGVLLGG